MLFSGKYRVQIETTDFSKTELLHNSLSGSQNPHSEVQNSLFQPNSDADTHDQLGIDPWCLSTKYNNKI